MIDNFSSLSTHVTMSRQQRLEHIKAQPCWDIIIIGGGITGAGILKLASEMKLKVLLLEQKDFAWGSSSRSSKMVHGGLRYMAQGQLKLTRESVRERQRLLTEAGPLIVKQSFVMGHYQKQFPWPWLFNQLLNAYDLVAGIKQHKFWSKQRYLSLVPKAKQPQLLGGSQFFDALTEDARLVQRLIQEALQLGGQAINYTKVLSLDKSEQQISGVTIADEDESLWQESKAQEKKKHIHLKAKVVINASGAWANHLVVTNAEQANNTAVTHQQSSVKMRPLRGSHLIFASWRLPVASAISVLHPLDQRPVQIYPWQNVTLVGTTDVEHLDNIDSEARISQAELDYLMLCVNGQFPELEISTADIISTFAGVRPVIASGGMIAPSKEKREHSIIQTPGLINVTGGKLTTFRLIAEQVMALASQVLNIAPISADTAMFSQVNTTLDAKFPPAIAQQILASYGAFSAEFYRQLDEKYGQPISYSRHLWAELIWSAKYEQIVHLDDLLLRRTRLGNVLPDGAQAQLAAIKTLCLPWLGWSERQWQDEVKRYRNIWQKYYSLPKSIV